MTSDRPYLAWTRTMKRVANGDPRSLDEIYADEYAKLVKP